MNKSVFTSVKNRQISPGKELKKKIRSRARDGKKTKQSLLVDTDSYLIFSLNMRRARTLHNVAMDPDDANDASWSTMSETSTSNTTASELEGACAMLLNEEAEDTLHLQKAAEDTLHREEAKDTLHLQKAAEDTLHREGMEDTTHLQKAAEDTLFRQDEEGQTMHLNKAASAEKPTQERGRTRHRRVRALSDGAKRMWESHRLSLIHI